MSYLYRLDSVPCYAVSKANMRFQQSVVRLQNTRIPNYRDVWYVVTTNSRVLAGQIQQFFQQDDTIHSAVY